MSISRIFSFTPVALLAWLAYSPDVVYARGRGGGSSGGHSSGSGSSGGGKSSLKLDSGEAAIFSFFIVFSVFTFYQLIMAFTGMVGRRKEGEDFARRRPFMVVLFLSTAALLVTYVLGAVIYSHPNTYFAPGVNAIFGLTQELGTEFLYTAFFILLMYRGSAQLSRFTGAPVGTSTAGTISRVVVFALLFIMLASTVVRTVMGAIVRVTDDLRLAYNALYHVYIGIYSILTFVILVASILLWKNRDPTYTTHELSLWDTNVLRRIMVICAPVLLIRALFEISTDIITSHKEFYAQVSRLGLFIASEIIDGVTYLWVIYVALGFGIPPKQKGQYKAVATK
ncbi:hypothetical protein AMATHDRAFT_5777 [Amanita thiersii Skay4041]|uniref:Uncharacterized protein n=1 Tax=Amanita thiersii Skay4041 TaxID=703135 RepID=A0A2A9NJQ0_9AGAR|nr:hypothetical protein AMATHDRAFT_5777 [Amanita thiersii Skay4041]